MSATPGLLTRIFANPLAIREVRQACRSWRLMVFLSVYLLIQAAIFAIVVSIGSDRGIFTNPTGTGARLFQIMTVVLVAVVAMVFPALSSTAIASEHERKSFDLLLLTPLAPWEIALGKFTAAALQAGVFLVATVPLFAMANLFGGVDPAAFFVTLWVAVMLSTLISFIGVYASSLVTRAIPAVLVTYVFAFVFGLVLLALFAAISVIMNFARSSVPMLELILQPTLAEAAYYLVSVSLTCAIYCTFLFLQTTNRLKPTSHNKSTNLRLYWTAVMVIVPLQALTYFAVARLPEQSVTYGMLVFGAVYLALLLLVPTLAASAEPPLPSRRVRRELARAPSWLRVGGGAFFPGGARGVAHTAAIGILGFVLLLGAGTACYAALDSRAEDPVHTRLDYASVTDTDGAGTVSATAAVEALGVYYKAEFTGFVKLCGVLLLTVLVISQIVWRISLSGLSRGVSSVLGLLLVVCWLVLPYVGQQLGPENSSPERQMIAQFSPVAAALSAAQSGVASGRAQILPPPLSSNLQSRADALSDRVTTFFLATLAVGLVLLVVNTASHGRVVRRFEAALAQSSAA